MVYQTKPKPLAFWITNISNRNVTLRDLSLTVKKYSSINLLSSHFHYTVEQIEKSIKVGSIHNKSNIIKIRKVEPEETPLKKIEVSDQSRFSYAARSNVKIEEVEYEELKVSEENFANEASEMFEEDNIPLIKR